MSAGKVDAGTRARVQSAIDTHVLPYVRNHGGDVEVVAVDEDGSVTRPSRWSA